MIVAWLGHGSAPRSTGTLARHRSTRPGTSTDAELIDEALATLLARDRAAEIDAAYTAAYTEHPLDEPDEWGDLASFREAAGR